MSFITYEQAGSIVTLTLNAPQKRNAIGTREDCDAVVDACRRIERDDSVRCVILTGADPAFCAGGDLKGMRDKTGMMAGHGPAAMRENYRRGIQNIPLALYELNVPTIAAVNGPAIGAGLDLACMCDMRVASERAIFAESFVRVGIVPGDGGAWLLPRIVGNAVAAEMSFTGDPLNAEQAKSVGLVSQVVPHENLLAAAQALAARVAKNPPGVLRMTKRLLREGQHASLATLLEMSAAFQAIAHETEDHREAVSAMLEKREPHFTGR